MVMVENFFLPMVACGDAWCVDASKMDKNLGSWEPCSLFSSDKRYHINLESIHPSARLAPIPLIWGNQNGCVRASKKLFWGKETELRTIKLVSIITRRGTEITLLLWIRTYLVIDACNFANISCRKQLWRQTTNGAPGPDDQIRVSSSCIHF